MNLFSAIPFLVKRKCAHNKTPQQELVAEGFMRHGLGGWCENIYSWLIS